MGFAIAGAAIIGGVVASEGSKSAASAQAGAAQYSADVQKQMYEETRQDQEPYRSAGYSALQQMNVPAYQKDFTMADFQADPGYAFRMQQGQQAIQRSAAARGGLNSGATMKALDSYTQGLGSQEYQAAYERFNNDRTTRYNRLASLAGLGQTATAQTGAAGASAANGIGQAAMAGANAQAAGIVGQANAINGAIGTVANGYMQSQAMRGGGSAGGATGGSMDTSNMPQLDNSSQYYGNL